MLNDDDLLKLWQKHSAAGWDVKWEAGFLKWLEAFASMSDADFTTVETQRLLWDSRQGGTLSYADTRPHLETLRENAPLVELLRETWRTSWPLDLEARAVALQTRFDALLAIVEPVAGGYGFARLSRVFSVLTPNDTHAGYVREKTDRIAAGVLQTPSSGSPHGDRVRAQHRLKALVGPPATLRETVLRSTFFWRVHQVLLEAKATKGSIGVGGGVDPVIAPLELFPYSEQFLGMFPVAGLSACFVAVLGAVREEPERDPLIDVLCQLPDYASLSGPSWGQILSRMAGLGLLQRDKEVYSVAPDGEALLEGDSMIVLRRLLERVYGMAQMLRVVEESPEGITEPATYARLQASYPNWTTARVPNALYAWLRSFGLFDKVDGRLHLSALGKAWASQLPATLPGPSVPPAPPEPPWTPPDLPTIRARFVSDASSKRLVIPAADLTALHHAWHALPSKRFVLLSGLSGTGKTQILLQYARHYLQGLPIASHMSLVPVSPDWRDETGLIGWPDAVDARHFHRGAALDLLLRAVSDPGRPYFLLLDEMNLARVERYLAPLLSAMESRQPMNAHHALDDVDGVPAEIPWPPNLFLGGTVNVDESTHPFSDKVLDRAFTFEYWDVDLAAAFERYSTREPDTEALLLALYEALHPARRHFGYRTAEEVVAFVACGDAPDRLALRDHAVLSKVLPKIRGGDGDGVREALQRVIAELVKAALPRSRQKAEQMLVRLNQAGMTGFF